MTASFAQTAVQLAGVATQFGSGFASLGASRSEASSLEAQSQLARQEAAAEARSRTLEVQKFRERQAGQYMMSGVALAGSPLLVLEETRRLGQEEVDSIVSRGDAISNIYKARAQQTRASGRMRFLGSLVEGFGQASKYFSDTTDYSRYKAPAYNYGARSGQAYLDAFRTRGVR